KEWEEASFYHSSPAEKLVIFKEYLDNCSLNPGDSFCPPIYPTHLALKELKDQMEKIHNQYRDIDKMINYTVLVEKRKVEVQIELKNKIISYLVLPDIMI